MSIDYLKNLLFTNGWGDPAQAVLLFIVIVGIVYGGLGMIVKEHSVILATLVYALLGAGFVYLGLWNLLIDVIWFCGLIFLAWFSSKQT